MKTVNLPQITREQAENEPAADRLTFPTSRPYPQNRATIQAVYDGFRVEFEIYDTAVGKVEQFIATLQERGYTPASAQLPAHQPTGNGAAPATDSPPVCRIHGRPMKEMKYPSKQGHAWHCTQKMGDGWCEERA